MKKLLIIQICVFLLFSGTLGGMFVSTDVYEDVKSGITSVLCLSCIKLEPTTQLDFTFDVAKGQDHSGFVLDSLNEGPVFIAYREDVCISCDEMEPILQDIFSVYFEKEDTFSEIASFDNSTVTFIHINIDHANTEQKESRFIYDKDHIGGVPQFTIITLGYDHGFIKPYYATIYGKLNLKTDSERKELLTKIIYDGIDLYNQNVEGYKSD